MSLDETIVAVASPAGSAERGIVRLSGPQALEIAGQLLKADDDLPPASWPTFRRRRGHVRLDPPESPLYNEGSAECTLPAEAYVFRAPRSYTGQNCVEIHTLGSPPVLEMVVERAVALGARQATPGEFTARAFLNGRMNLTRAEAVAALIQAESDAQLVAAQAMMRGDLSQAIAQWQENLAELTALVEAEIDFAEEPIEFIAPQELGRRLRDLEREIEELMARSASMSRLDLLPTVLLMGPPNAGKSTLMNALSGVDRSMCSPVAGTTRDILSAPARIGSVEVILLDSAGLAPGQGNAPAPPLTKGGLGGVGIAMMPEISRAVLDRARSVDCVCLVLDPSSDANGIPSEALEPPAGRPTVVAINKIDLLQPNDLEKTRRILEAFRWGPVCPISAKEGLGLDGLRQALNDVLVNAPVIDDCAAIHLNVRQESALRAAKLAIASAAEESGRCGETLDRAELIALCLREGLEALGAVTGAVTTEDLLTTVFANFCIGK